MFLRKLSCATHSTGTYFELQPQIPYNTSFSCRHFHAAMLPPCSTIAAITAAVLLPLLPCCRTAAATLLPPLRFCGRHAAASAAVLPPSCRRCQAAAAATKLTPLPLFILQDRFDNEKEFCTMTDVDFF
jgi:hypothetical protein